MRSRPYTKECCSYFHGIDVGQLDGAFRIYQKLTPFLDSLYLESLSFDHFIQRAYIPTTECMPPSTLSLPS